MMYVCSNCRDGRYYEAEELETSKDVEPHGEVTTWTECPKCLSRDDLIPLQGEGLDSIRSYARHHVNSLKRQWAVDVLYDIASEQVLV